MSDTELPEMSGTDPFDLMAAEAARIDAFYTSLPQPQRDRPTRCPSWSRRDLQAHLDAVEEYTAAGLSGQELLDQWRHRRADNLRRLRARHPLPAPLREALVAVV